MKRKDVVGILKTLLPFCQAAEVHYRAVAQQSGDSSSKTRFILYWQKYAQCIAEIEHKITSYGGEIESSPVLTQVSEEKVLEAYERMLSKALPIDIRMLIQRHMGIFKEIAKNKQPHQMDAHCFGSEPAPVY